MNARLGTPRVHHRSTDSTNDRARSLAIAGAPHGTLVTAGEQRAGRGRQGRSWDAPARRALLMSLVLREWPPLLPIAGAVAVADVAAVGRGPIAIKWPNDVLLDGRKVAGVLGERRAPERWAVLGIGLNVAVRAADLPPELRGHAATLGLEPDAIEPMLERLLRALELRLVQPTAEMLAGYRARDALAGREVRWEHGAGIARGIDDFGRLLVDLPDGSRAALDAGEVHLRRAAPR